MKIYEIWCINTINGNTVYKENLPFIDEPDEGKIRSFLNSHISPISNDLKKYRLDPFDQMIITFKFNI